MAHIEVSHFCSLTEKSVIIKSVLFKKTLSLAIISLDISDIDLLSGKQPPSTPAYVTNIIMMLGSKP